MNAMFAKLFFAADHGGLQLKQKLLEQIEQQRDSNEVLTTLEIVDLGPFELDPQDDYPIKAFELAEQVAAAAAANIGGVLICRSGIGMSIAANKVNGAYAALCFTHEHATKAREHNNANILVLDADYGGDDPLDLLLTFLTTQFGGERHLRRVNQIKAYELQHD